MYRYDVLEPECYYLVQLEESSPLTLIQAKVITDFAMYIIVYDTDVSFKWVKKTDSLNDIIELLSDDAAQKWLDVFTNSEQILYGGNGNNPFGNNDDDL